MPFHETPETSSGLIMAVSESSFVQQGISGPLLNVWLDFLNICNFVKITTHWRIPIHF